MSPDPEATMDTEALKGHLDLLLLGALREEPLHGYALIAKIRRQTLDEFTLAEGTVYPALHKLERQALVQSSWAEVSGRRRRLYRLTRKGHRALAERTRAWQRFSQGIAAVIGERQAWESSST